MFGTYFYGAHRILPPYQFDTNQIQGRNCAIGLKCTCYYVLVSLCPPPVVLVGLQSVDDSQGRANTSFHPRTPGHDK